MSIDMATEPLDIEQKTRVTITQHLAFKAACAELGLKQADVLRVLLVQFLRLHHRNQSLQALGLGDMTGLATDRD